MPGVASCPEVLLGMLGSLCRDVAMLELTGASDASPRRRPMTSDPSSAPQGNAGAPRRAGQKQTPSLP